MRVAYWLLRLASVTVVTRRHDRHETHHPERPQRDRPRRPGTRSSATRRRFSNGAWLASLEEAGCVTRRTGWLPQHLALWDDGERLVGACPLYVKGHSQGEFVFDHGWAQAAAARRHPVLPEAPRRDAVHARDRVSASSRTRAPTARPWCAQLGDGAPRALRLRTATRRCTSTSAGPTRPTALEALGYVRRTGYQFQWINPGWRTFDDYLAALRSKRRNQVRRERRELAAQDVEITTHRR